VKLLSNKWLVPVAALALLAAPLAAAVAQNLKPVAIVSVASIKENLDDVGYLTRVAGMEDAGKSARFFAGALTTGIDREKPIGLYVVPQAGDFHAVAFIPVTDLKMLLSVHKEQVGEPKDLGNGMLEIGTGRTAVVKEQAGWAFLAESKEHLTNLPQDPVSLLGNLPKTYNVAAKLLVQNIPEELRKMAIDEIKVGMARFLDSPAARQGNLNRDQAEKLSKMYIGNIERLINEADELFIGLGIDETAKRTVLDIGFSGKEGTSLARQMALQADAKTQFAGFLLPDASVTLNFVSKASQEDIEQIGPALKVARDQWAKQIDDAPGFPAEKREAAKKVLGQFLEIVENTVRTGKMDGGAALMLMPKAISFVAGGTIADAAAMEKALKDALELGKGQPDFPQVQLNAGALGDVKLHRLTAAIPNREPEARELLGDKLEIVVGIGPKSVFVSGGKGAEALLKKVLDRSAAEKDKTVPPLQLNIALLPILKFYKSVDDNPIVAGLISALEQSSSDRITITSEAGARNSTTRIEIQEGVIKAIGGAAKAFGAGYNRNAL
jgi:hypothetical protein